MQRRDFLFGIAAAAGILPFARPGFPQESASIQTTKLIDAHCHIFNANDLPMVGFVEKAVLPNLSEYRGELARYGEVVGFYLSFTAKWLEKKAFTAKAEIELLKKIASGSAKQRTLNQVRQHEIALLIGLIDEIKQLRLQGEFKLANRIIASYAPIILIGVMHREAFPDRFNVKGYSFAALNDNSDGAMSPENWQPAQFLAEQLYITGDGPVTFYTKFVLQLTRYRHELADELSRIHRNKLVLMTPALVDFAKWLDVADPTPNSDQVEVMTQISRRHTGTAGPYVHGFVAFDPLRQAIHEKLGYPEADSPFALVQRAVEGDRKVVDGQEVIDRKGFIGVKLYPPMGFRAAMNSSIGNDFPCFVRFGTGSPGFAPTCTGARNTPDGLGSNPGPIIDDVLARLFGWCAEKGVPILTHAHDSYGSGPGYGTRADPQYWDMVLQKFPSLRVNMAHFGNFDNAFTADNRFDETKVTSTWEWTIGNIWKRDPDANAYADISYFQVIFDDDACGTDKACRREQTKSLMIQFKATFEKSASRLLYGSDWILTGLERKFPSPNQPRQYPDLVADFLHSEVKYSAAEVDDIMFNNAFRFLGLTKNDLTAGNRGRLEAFYADFGGDPSWMNALDAI